MKLKNLETRRSIRSYTDAKLTQEQIENILNSAQFAPTTMGTQAFKLLVIKRGDVPADTFKSMVWGQAHPSEADMNVIVFTLKSDEVDKNWLSEKLSYVPEDQRAARVEMAIGHFKSRYDLSGTAFSVAYGMALEADANGVGSTIYTGFDKDAIEKYFAGQMPSNYEAVLGVSFGIKSEKAMVYPKALKPLSDFVVEFKK